MDLPFYFIVSIADINNLKTSQLAKAAAEADNLEIITAVFFLCKGFYPLIIST